MVWKVALHTQVKLQSTLFKSSYHTVVTKLPVLQYIYLHLHIKITTKNGLVQGNVGVVVNGGCLLPILKEKRERKGETKEKGKINYREKNGGNSVHLFCG